MTTFGALVVSSRLQESQGEVKDGEREWRDLREKGLAGTASIIKEAQI